MREQKSPDSDQILIQRALSGDQQAFKELLERHKSSVFHVTYRIVHNQEEAHDLVQETFMKAFAALGTYRSQFRFTTWLYRIAANCAIDALRKKKIEALSLDQPLETRQGEITVEVADNRYDPEANLVEQQQRISISQAIKSLPPKYREVLLLRHRDEKPYEEIAQILKIPVGTVKARIFRARELLKKKLKKYIRIARRE